MTMRTGLLLFLFAVGCGPKELTDVDAKQLALDILPEGTVESVLKGKHGEDDVYKLEVKMPSGGTVEMLLEVDDGELHELEAKEGPFDYDVQPTSTSMKLSQAVASAKEQKAGEVEAWIFENEEGGVWEVYIRTPAPESKLFEIKMNAVGGDKKVIEKQMVD